MKIKKNPLYLLAICLLVSCHKDKEETVTLEIVNGLNNKVRIEFYDKGFPSGEVAAEIDGAGSLFKGSDTARVVQVNQILEADSIVLIFDNMKIEQHLLLSNIPRGNSILNGDSYTEVDGVFTYTVDSRNLDNALPCDGPCR